MMSTSPIEDGPLPCDMFYTPAEIWLHPRRKDAWYGRRRTNSSHTPILSRLNLSLPLRFLGPLDGRPRNLSSPPLEPLAASEAWAWLSSPPRQVSAFPCRTVRPGGCDILRRPRDLPVRRWLHRSWNYADRHGNWNSLRHW